MDIDLEKLYSESLKLFESCAETVLTNLPGDNTELKNEFAAGYLDHCNKHLEFEAREKALEHAKSVQDDDPDAFKNRYEAKFQQEISISVSPSRHPKYLEFTSKLEGLCYDRVDFEEQATKEQPTEGARLDPFTKKPIDVPIRNRNCGHLYDKNSIEEILRVNKKIRCPVVGCAFKNYFMLQDLHEFVQDANSSDAVAII